MNGLDIFNTVQRWKYKYAKDTREIVFALFLLFAKQLNILH